MFVKGHPAHSLKCFQIVQQANSSLVVLLVYLKGHPQLRQLRGQLSDLIIKVVQDVGPDRQMELWALDPRRRKCAATTTI